MGKKKGFDYLGEIESRTASKTPEPLLQTLNSMDSGFFYSTAYKDAFPDKIANPCILLTYERGSMENSYVYISLSDREDDGGKNLKLIGCYYVKDYFKLTMQIHQLMSYMQLAVLEICRELYKGTL